MLQRTADHCVFQLTASSSEPVGNYVRLELRRGKWDKRWLALEGDQLTYRKSESSRDKTTLCTLTNWELFNVPSEYHDQLKPPKPFALALKSTDRLEIFEKVDEAVYYFSVKSEQERDLWMALILDARVSR